MSEVDWSKAPDGAEFYAHGGFWFLDIEDKPLYWHYHSMCWSRMFLSIKFDCLKSCDSYEERPKQDCETATNCVKSPSHYQLIDGVESIEIIARSMTCEQWKGFCLGNMLKYRIRAGKKDDLQQDIDKANFYGELYEMHKGKCYE